MPADPFDLAARFRLAPPPGEKEAGVTDDGGPREPGSGEAAYVCDACGEEIVVPVDPAAGSAQVYTEDCPVCCRPNLLTVTFGPDGVPRCVARSG